MSKKQLVQQFKKKSILSIFVLLLVVVGLVFLARQGIFGNQLKDTSREATKFTTGGFDLSDKKAAIDPSSLRQGCPIKDCIPSIDEPNFESVDEANSWLNSDDVVFAVDLNGISRAYPQRIMNWHEIVNDDFGQTPVVVTFCPLCGTAIAFERVIDGEAVEFGVSGKLLQSSLVMYDRATDTLWQHTTGTAIIGDLVGTRLTQVPMETTTWGEWRLAYQDGQVLSRNTGYGRDYDAYPYGDYESSGRISFPVDREDDRLHPKTIGYGVEIGDEFKFYPDEAIGTTPTRDTFAGRTLEIRRDKSGGVVITDVESGENINFLRGMWFSWFAFNPSTELYQ